MAIQTPLTKLGLFIAVIFLASCVSMAPKKAALWDVPERFTQEEVFKAAVQAGLQQGFQLNASNPEYGIISFRRKLGKGERSVGVNIKSLSGVIQVKITTSVNTNELIVAALAGSEEEMAQQFYGHIFNELGITSDQEKHFNIRLLKK